MSSGPLNGSMNGPLVGGWLKHLASSAMYWAVLNPHALELYAAPAPQGAPVRVVPRAQIQFVTRDKYNKEPIFYIYSQGIRDLAFQSVAQRPPAPAGAPAEFAQVPRADDELNRWLKAFDKLGVKDASDTIPEAKFKTPQGMKEYQEKVSKYGGGQPAPTFSEEDLIALHPGGAAGYAAEKNATPLNGSMNTPIVGGWLKHVTSSAMMWCALNQHAFEMYAAPTPQGAPLRIIPRAQIQFITRDKYNREPLFYIYSQGIRDLAFQSVNERPPVVIPASGPQVFKQDPKPDNELDRWLKAFSTLGVKDSSDTIPVAKFTTPAGRKEYQEKVSKYGGGQPEPTFTEQDKIELHPGGAAGYAAEQSAGPLNGSMNGPIVGGWLKHVPTSAMFWAVLNPHAFELYTAPAPQGAPARVIPRAQIQFLARDKKTREPFFYIYSQGIRDLAFQSIQERPPVVIPANGPQVFKQDAKADNEIDRWIKAFSSLNVNDCSATIDPARFTTAKGRADYQEVVAGYGGGQPKPTFTDAEKAEIDAELAAAEAAKAAKKAASAAPASSSSAASGGYNSGAVAPADQAEEEEYDDGCPRANGFKPGMSIYADVWVGYNGTTYFGVFSDQGIELYNQQYRSNNKVEEQPKVSIDNSTIRKYASASNKSREPALILFGPGETRHVFTIPPEKHGAAAANRFKVVDKILGGFGLFNPIPGASWPFELQRDFVNNRAGFEAQVAEYTGGN